MQIISFAPRRARGVEKFLRECSHDRPIAVVRTAEQLKGDDVEGHMVMHCATQPKWFKLLAKEFGAEDDVVKTTAAIALWAFKRVGGK